MHVAAAAAAAASDGRDADREVGDGVPLPGASLSSRESSFAQTPLQSECSLDTHVVSPSAGGSIRRAPAPAAAAASRSTAELAPAARTPSWFAQARAPVLVNLGAGAEPDRDVDPPETSAAAEGLELEDLTAPGGIPSRSRKSLSLKGREPAAGPQPPTPPSPGSPKPDPRSIPALHPLPAAHATFNLPASSPPAAGGHSRPQSFAPYPVALTARSGAGTSLRSPVKRLVGPIARHALSVRVLLIVPTVLTLVVSNVIIWYLGYRSSAESIARLTAAMEADLLAQLSFRADQFAESATVAARAIADEFFYGRLNPNDLRGLRSAMWSLMKNRPYSYSITLGFENGYAVAYRPDNPETINPLWNGRGYQYYVTMNASCSDPNMPTESFLSLPLPNFVVFNADRSGDPHGDPIIRIPDYDVKQRIFYRTAVDRRAAGWSSTTFASDGTLTVFRCEPLVGSDGTFFGAAGVGVHVDNFGDAARGILQSYGGATAAFAIERRSEQYFLFTTIGSATRHVPNPNNSLRVTDERLSPATSDSATMREIIRALEAAVGPLWNLQASTSHDIYAAGSSFLAEIFLVQRTGIDWIYVFLIDQSVIVDSESRNKQIVGAVTGAVGTLAVLIAVITSSLIVLPLRSLSRRMEDLKEMRARPPSSDRNVDGRSGASRGGTTVTDELDEQEDAGTVVSPYDSLSPPSTISAWGPPGPADAGAGTGAPLSPESQSFIRYRSQSDGALPTVGEAQAHASQLPPTLRRRRHNSTRPVISEFREIDDAFRAMERGVRSFEKYVPGDYVRLLVRSRILPKPGLTHHTCAIMFADIQNFTTLTETMAPERLVEVVGEAMEALSQRITQAGGTVDKYIGDAVMAFFSTPMQPLDMPAGRVCEAALACQAVLGELRPRWLARGLPALEVRIGIDVGRVLIGNFGSSTRLNYTVLGDNVNVAARLEPLNKRLGTSILVTDNVAMAPEVRERFLTRIVDKVVLKGRRAATVVYELLAVRERATADQVAAAAGYEAAFNLYLARRFGEAAAAFEGCEPLLEAARCTSPLFSRSYPDRSARNLAERCLELEKSPPPESWDGADLLSEKFS